MRGIEHILKQMIPAYDVREIRRAAADYGDNHHRYQKKQNDQGQAAGPFYTMPSQGIIRLKDLVWFNTHK